MKSSVKTTTTKRIAYSRIGSKKKEFLDLFSKYLSETGYRRSACPVHPRFLNLEFEKPGFNLYYPRLGVRVDNRGNDLIVRLLAFPRIKSVLAVFLPFAMDLFALLFLVFNPSLQHTFIENPMVILPPLLGIFVLILIIFTVIPSLIFFFNRRSLLKSLEEISNSVASELGGIALTPFTYAYEVLTSIPIEEQMKPRGPFIAQIKFQRTAMVLSWINPILASVYMRLKYKEASMHRILLSLLLGPVQAYVLFLVLINPSSTNISLLVLITVAFTSIISLIRVFQCPNCGKEVQIKKQKCPYCNTEFQHREE